MLPVATFNRVPRTAGHPPAGTVQIKSPPGYGAARYNEMATKGNRHEQDSTDANSTGRTG